MPNADYKNKDSRSAEWACDKDRCLPFTSKVTSFGGQDKRSNNVGNWVEIAFERYSS